jgi:hypothetical protein
VPDLPGQSGETIRTYVAAIDADGNERGALALPDLTVPVATVTGWNPRHAAIGGAGQIIAMQGSTIPFAPNEAARQESRDPRPSIAARYRNRADFLARVDAAGRALMADGFILEADLPIVLANAAERYDAFTAEVRAPVGAGHPVG